MSASPERTARPTSAWRRRWEAVARAQGLDPRREYWGWDPAGRLLVRPGLALRAARGLAAAAPGAAPLLVLRAQERWQVGAARSSLRRAPAHAAEQVSQLRLGDDFTVWHWDAERAWCLGAGEDGYPGWLRAWQLAPASERAARQVVCARWSRALAAPDAGAAVLVDLSFGTRLARSGAARAGYVPWRLPDGRRAWTPVVDLAPWPGRRGQAAARTACVGRGMDLLGLPYEWGGSSSAGVDCSGLVQLLLGSLGHQAPRDADLQAAWSRPCALGGAADWQPGNLLFYGEPRVDHVGIMVGDGRLLHASGEVRLDPLGPGGTLRGRAPRALGDPFSAP